MKNVFTSIILCFAFCAPLAAQTGGKHFQGQSEFIKYEAGKEPRAAALAYILKEMGFDSRSGLQLINNEPDMLGMIHERYMQTHDGYPVDGTMWIVHTKNGKIESMNGVLANDFSASRSVVLSKEAACRIAKKAARAKEYYPSSDVGELYWATTDYTATLKNFRLCYRFDIFASSEPVRKYVFVDVATGKVVTTHEQIQTADVNGTAITAFSGTQTIVVDSYNGSFRLRETGRGGGIETYNLNNGMIHATAVDFTDADNTWNNVNAKKDQYATDAHWGAEMTYDYFKLVHNRNSLDNAGMKLRSYVHYSTNYLNAFWNGSVMTYGDGSSGYNPLTSLDICGHEMSHGVVRFSSNLFYANESGALNEGFADCMGTAVEFYARPTNADWLMSKDIGAPFRNLSNPNQYGHPDTYKGQSWYFGLGDNGGVHTNSGVLNFWFYLLSEGGAGTNDLGNAYNVTSITLQKAAAVLYRANVMYLTQTSKYQDARTYTIQAATDLYGACSQEVTQVANAWYAVGLGGAVPTPVPVVSVTASPGVLVCPGSAVTFTATATNAGSSPTYQWKLNGTTVGANSPTYTTSSLSNNDKVTCIVTASSSCGSSSDTSEALTILINPGVAAAITMDPAGSVCAGTDVTFKASVINGGTNPSYQWKVNGANVGINSPTYVRSTFANNDQVSCVVTANVSCGVGNPATSNVITMTVNPGIILRPGANGKDAHLAEVSPNTPNGNAPELLSAVWTCGGSKCLARGLIEFDLSTLPPGAIITGAYLNLYAHLNASNGYTGQPTYGMDNAGWLRRVTAPWSESTVTWNTQPTFTTQNQVTLAQSTSTAQNYLNVDVTSLVQDMVSNGNYGFLLMGKNETNWYNSLIFYSGDYSDSTKRPSLRICYIPDLCTPDVNISASPGSLICPGELVKFTAIPTNGGIAPVYQWKVNGANVGTNSSTFTSTTLGSNDKVTCVLTSSVTCSGGASDTSNAITMSMNATGAAAVSIVTPNGTVCKGTAVTFTATPTNGGPTPSYQWKVNGANVGANSATYTSNSLSNGDVITCVMTSSSPCATGSPATSNPVAMIVTPGLVLQPGSAGKDALISALNTNTVAGNVPNFTSYTWTCGGILCVTRALIEFDLSALPPGATINNAYLSLYADKNSTLGYPSTPTYGNNNSAWLRRLTAPWSESTVTWNNQPAYTTTNEVTLAQSTSAAQNYLNIDVTALVNDMVTNGNYGFIMMGKNEVNWYNSLIFGSSDNPDSTIRPRLQICYTPAVCTPTVSITATPSADMCAGTGVIFNAVPTNGGISPAYQWKLNGGNVGSNSSVYSNNSLVAGDKVTCVMTSNASCAPGSQSTSNELTMTVQPYPSAFNVTGGGVYCTEPGTGSVIGLSGSQSGVSYQLVYNGATNIGLPVPGTGSAISFGSQLPVGSYTVRGINNLAGCMTNMNGSVSVAVMPSPTIDTLGAIPFCFGDSIRLSSSLGAAYEWSNGKTTQSIYVKNPGTYTVKTDQCTSAGVEIVVLPVPTPDIEAGGSTNNCIDSTVILNDINFAIGTTYQWKKNGVDIPGATDPSVTVQGNGTYMVVETGPLGCSATDSMVISIQPPSPITITANKTNFCSNDSSEICAPAGLTSYIWNVGATGRCIFARNSQNYYVTATDVNGCTVESNHLSLSVYPVPSVSIIRNGDTLSSYNAVSYQWYKDGSKINGATSQVYIASSPGSYSVEIMDANGCLAMSSNIVVTGLDDLIEGEEVSIYPNPTGTGGFQLMVSEKIVGSEIDVFDDNGRLVHHAKVGAVSTNYRLNISAGIYFIRIYSEAGSVMRKLIRL